MEERGTAFAAIHSAFMTAVQLLEAERASLLLRDAAQPVFTIAASIGIDPELASSISVPMGQGIAGVVAEQGAALFGEADGTTFLSIPVMTDNGVEGVLNVTHRRGNRQYSARDIPLATSAATHIAHLIQYGRFAVRDPVSGLPNRRAFEEAIRRELALSDRTGTPFTVVFVDLDNLKTINDRFGHGKGDEAIGRVGEALQRILRPYDFAGRYGGDEFALLLAGAGDESNGVARRIADALDAVSLDLEVQVSASVGMASWPKDGRTGEELLAISDDRMYQQKRAKKGSAR